MPDIFDLSNCRLCPRSCGVDRLSGETGRCGEAGVIRAARAALMYYEEPCISGKSGSGAVFFTGCSLGCIFCQNYGISSAKGSERSRSPAVSESRLSEIFLELQEQGAANINLVTGTHFLPGIISALEHAKHNGLHIPVVYNTSSYERPEAIAALRGLVDIYLPDLKFMSPDLGARYAAAPDYFETASAAIDEMVRQHPEPLFEDGSHSLEDTDSEETPMMKKGVIVRHMVMPGHAEDSRRILRYLLDRYGDSVFISIMNQYTPMPHILKTDLAQKYPDLAGTVSQKEYDEVVDFAILSGISNGFIQEGGTVSESFIPLFDGTGIRPHAVPEMKHR